MSIKRLSSDNLKKIKNIQMPKYIPENHGIGVAHIGIGAFHRAHQAYYFDKLIEKYGGDWRIIGISLRSQNAAQQLMPQGCLYTLIETGNENTYKIMAPIAEVLVAPQNPQLIIETLASPNIKIISLTITEKGYYNNLADGGLDLNHPDILHDLGNETPITAIGYLINALKIRRKNNLPLPTILSCDNMMENGKLLKQSLVQFANAQNDTDFTQWIMNNVKCPSTMVDRIVPATTQDDLENYRQKFNIQDMALVKTEKFTQWVIEDDFGNNKPPLDEFGVQFVPNVKPYEQAKLRLLNGSHSALAYIGLLYGYEYVHQAIADKKIYNFISNLMDNEMMPSIANPDDINLVEYKQKLLARFSNQGLPHSLKQIAADGSKKIPNRLVLPMQYLIDNNKPFDAIAYIIAAWIIYAAQTTRSKNGVLDDPLAQQLSEIVNKNSDYYELIPAIIGIDSIFGILQNKEIVTQQIKIAMRTLIAELKI